jgi:hypothetical protein
LDPSEINGLEWEMKNSGRALSSLKTNEIEMGKRKIFGKSESIISNPFEAFPYARSVMAF